MVIYWDLMGFTGIFHGNQCWFECWVFMMISNVNSYCRFLWWSNGGVKRKFLVVARLVSRAGQLWWRSTTRNDGMEYQRDTLKFLPIFLSSMNIISGLSNGIHQTKSSFLEYQEYQTKYQTFHVWATLWNSSHLEILFHGICHWFHQPVGLIRTRSRWSKSKKHHTWHWSEGFKFPQVFWW